MPHRTRRNANGVFYEYTWEPCSFPGPQMQLIPINTNAEEGKYQEGDERLFYWVRHPGIGLVVKHVAGSGWFQLSISRGE